MSDESEAPQDYKSKKPSKRLAAIEALAFGIIPQDPSRDEYRQGQTLGPAYKRWFRAKFFQQYRLFFRYHAASKIIVYAWVNDEDSLRGYGSGDDAYRAFGKMLKAGNPPDDLGGVGWANQTVRLLKKSHRIVATRSGHNSRLGFYLVQRS